MKKASDFRLKDKDGKLHSLKGLDSEFVVLYFYPKDNTPGCTIEAKGFSDDKEKFAKLGAEIIGISGGDEKSKEKFCGKNDLDITLLSDPKFEVSEKYGVYGEKKFMGKTFMGIKRTTFIIDKDRNIIKVFDKVKPIIHSKEVLDHIKQIKKIKN